MIDKLLSILLSSQKLRRRVIFNLKNNYFHELDHSIPLSNGYWANLLESDAYDSFAEIFIQQEYLKFLPEFCPLKVLDIGANYGFFSLWLQSHFSQNKISSIMIEASTNCHKSLEKLVNQKSLGGRFKWIHRAVADPSKKFVDFFNRPHMASSIFANFDNQKKIAVPVLTCEEVLDSYDLIKCDIEGS